MATWRSWCYFGCGAVTVLSLACVQPDSASELTPYLVSQSETPAFESTLQYNAGDQVVFQLTVADADVLQGLEVRFCLRESTDAAALYVLAASPIPVTSTPDHAVERLPIASPPIGVCDLYLPTSEVRLLYAFVAAPDACASSMSCEVLLGRGYDSAFWRFTCDKP